MKWFKRVLPGALGLALPALVGFFASSEYVINKRCAAESRILNLADVEAESTEGKRLLRVS